MRHIFITALALIGVHEHLSAEQKHDLIQAGYQTAPGVTAATGAQLLGVQMSNILTAVTIVFVVAQLLYLAWKWRRDARREDERIEDRRRGVPAPVCEPIDD